MPLSFAVIICSFDVRLLHDLDEAIQSVRSQCCSELVDIIVCVDGNTKLYHLLASMYENVSGVTMVSTGRDKPLGLAHARNIATTYCSQDVISFLDDDAIADPHWIAELAESFAKYRCLIVAGKILPRWKSLPPRWLTPVFYWLVGATGDLLQDRESYVRSGFGSNISCIREALVKVGLLESSLGRRGSTLLQAEDADLGLRVNEVFGKLAVYNPRAVVFHKVGPERLRISYLLKRAYLQGKSKAIMFGLHGRNPSVLGQEYHYLRRVLGDMIRTATQLVDPANLAPSLERLFCSICITSAVVLGFLLNVMETKFRTTLPAETESLVASGF